MVLALAAAAPARASPTPPAADSSAPSVLAQTESGWVLGKADTSVRKWLGIPYAQPPTGKMRWRNPAPPVSWFPQIYQADAEGYACPQRCTLPAGYCPPETRTSEDCLYANVITPLAEPDAGTLYPVLVYFHGGGFNAGYGGGAVHDPTGLVSRTNTIVVTFNFRLGVLGSMRSPIPNVGGNLGLVDQVSMMRWVHNNIRRFGGDPARVTLWGQDSGAMAVAAHMANPQVWKYFARVILSSDPFGLPLRNGTEAERLGSDFASAANCSDTDMECLLDIPVAAVLQAQHLAAAKMFPVGDNYRDMLQGVMPWSPIVGEFGVKRQPIDAWARGEVAPADVMLGAVSNASSVLVRGYFTNKLSKEEYQQVLAGAFGAGNVPAINHQYPMNGTSDLRPTLIAAMQDATWVCPARNASLAIAQGPRKVFLYRFRHAWSFASHWGTQYQYCWPEACLLAELPFLMRTEMLALFTAAEITMSDDMLAAWGAFAATGDPNPSGGSPFPAWKPYGVPSTAGGRRGAVETDLMVFDTPLTVTSDLDGARCRLWDNVGYLGPAHGASSHGSWYSF